MSEKLELRPLKSTEAHLIELVAAEYRTMWAEFRQPPFACDFTGSRVDIDVLDFIEYEAGHHPRGMLGAAMIWGIVIAKTGLLGWYVNESGDYFLSDDLSVLIWPYARTVEVKNSLNPQFAKHEWLIEQAVSDCLMSSQFSEKEQKVLIRLTDPEPAEGFCYSVDLAIQKIRGRASAD